MNRTKHTLSIAQTPPHNHPHFQRLEKRRKNFPTTGKKFRFVSNHWNPSQDVVLMKERR